MIMSPARMIELALAAAVFGLGVWLYRARRQTDDGYGSQGAVILLAVGAIIAIHGFGLLKYHPSKAEAEMIQERGR